MRICIFLFFSLLMFETQAQLYFSDSKENIGVYDVSDCSYEILASQNLPSHSLNDIALSPDGRLFGCNSDFDNIYIFEINTTDFLSIDTIAVIETGWGSTSLVCSSDYVLYFGYGVLYSYDLVSNEINYHGAFPNLYKLHGDLIWFNNDLYGSTAAVVGVSEEFPPQFIKMRLDTIDTQYSEVVTEGFPVFGGLGKSYDYETHQIKLIGSFADPFTSGDTTKFYEINLQDTTDLELCSSVIQLSSSYRSRVYGLTSPDEFRTNFHLQLDLDVDNSQGRLIDHFITDSLCTRVYRLSDDDVGILSPAEGIDSMVVEIVSSDFEMSDLLLTLAEDQSTFNITGMESNQIVVWPMSTATVADYENLVRLLRLEITADSLIASESRVDFRLYSGSEVSDPAMAFVRTQPELIPYAGEDYDMTVCWPSNSDLFPGLGEEVYADGYWQPALHNNGNRFNVYTDEPGDYLYIAQEGSCVADTAVVNVSILPRPAINYGHSIEEVQLVYLCSGDTALWVLNTTELVSWEWLDGYVGSIRPITEGGIYRLFATDLYGCEHLVRTTFHVPDWNEPTVLQDTVSRCEGAVLSFFGHTVTTNQVICEQFLSTSNCDYTHCRTFVFTPPVNHYKEEVICEGDTYWFGETPITETGDYEAIIEGGECDTLLQLSLTVHPVYERNLIVGLSPGGSYEVGDSVLTEAGFYDILLQSSQGCDSLIHVEIEITNSAAEPYLPKECRLPSVLYKGQQNLSFPFDCACQLLEWQVFDVHGHQVIASQKKQTLLSSGQQLNMASGLYFYQLLYECNGVLYRNIDKLILVQ